MVINDILLVVDLFVKNVSVINIWGDEYDKFFICVVFIMWDFMDILCLSGEYIGGFKVFF